jgi:hypothetical protein
VATSPSPHHGRGSISGPKKISIIHLLCTTTATVPSSRPKPAGHRPSPFMMVPASVPPFNALLISYEWIRYHSSDPSLKGQTIWAERQDNMETLEPCLYSLEWLIALWSFSPNTIASQVRRGIELKEVFCLYEIHKGLVCIQSTNFNLIISSRKQNLFNTFLPPTNLQRPAAR